MTIPSLTVSSFGRARAHPNRNGNTRPWCRASEVYTPDYQVTLSDPRDGEISIVKQLHERTHEYREPVQNMVVTDL